MPKVIIRNKTGKLVRWQPCFSSSVAPRDSDCIPDHSRAKLIEPGKKNQVPGEEYLASRRWYTNLPHQKFNGLIENYFTRNFEIQACIWAEDLKNAEEIVLTCPGGKVLFSKKERRGCFPWFSSPWK